MLTISTTGLTHSNHFGCTRLSPSCIVVVLVVHISIFAPLFISRNIPVRVPSPTVMVHWLTQTPETQENQPPPPSQPRQATQEPVRATAPNLQQPLHAQRTERKTATTAELKTEYASANNSQPEVQTVPAAPAAAPAHGAVTESHAPDISEPRFNADFLSNPAPAYPPLSRRLGEEGKVILRVLVEPTGLPAQVELKKSSGSPRLDHAASKAIWQWKFVPAHRGHEAISAWVLIPIVFNLKG